MSINFNTAPYYDDFDADDGFLRILFNPGRAVQARELTQIQSILQNQLKSGADHIWQDGTPVLGGTADLNKHHYIQLAIADASWLGRVVYGQTSGAIGRVNRLHDDETQPIYYIQPLSGAFGLVEEMTTYDTVCNSGVYDDEGHCSDNTWYRSGLAQQNGSIIAAGIGVEATVNNGIFYVGGKFVPVLEQTIFVDYTSEVPTATVGFDIEEKIIEANQDERLLDPASGFYNQNAPGADRYSVNLKLVTEANSAEGVDFLPIIDVVEGKIITRVKSTAYSTVIKELAQRTYDESGDYTTQTFPIVVKDHETDTEQYSVKINPGKAYVKGYEHELLSPIEVSAPKARDTRSVSADHVRVEFGPYFEVESVADVNGVFNVVNKEKVVFITNASYTGVEAVLTVGPSDRRITHFTAFGNAFRIYVDQPSGLDVVKPATYIVSANDPTVFVKLSRPTGEAVPLGTFRPWIYEMGSMVSNVVPGQTNFYTQKDFSVNCGGSTTTIGTDFTSMHWEDILYVWDTTTGNLIPKNSTAVTAGLAWEATYTNETATLLIVDAGNNDTPDSSLLDNALRILGNTYISIGNPRSVNKTSVSLVEVEMNAVNKLPLPTSTVRVTQVVDAITGDDVSDSFTFINTDFDTTFEPCFCLWVDEDTPAVPGSTYRVSYEYLSFGNTTNASYFNVNSYTDNLIEYDDILTYAAYYEPYGNFRLADSLDFRVEETDFANGTYLPLPDSNITVSYDYYLPRADRLTVNSDGVFRISQGFSSEAAKLPSEKDTEMTLYNFYVPAYTYDVDNISATYVDQKNFTMSDLRELEERVDSLEYYTSLNLLEQTTESMQVTDENGLDRYKNGMLVDSFTDHGIGDYTNDEYYISIYPEGGICTTPFTMKGFDFEVAGSPVGMRQNSRSWTLDFDVVEGWISQQFASQVLNLNPFAKLSWIGFLEISPNSDTWFEETYAPAVIVQNENNNNVRRQVELFGTQTRWGSWNTTWTGWKDTGGKKNYVAGATETRWRGRTANVHPGNGIDRPHDVNDINGKTGADGHTNILGLTLDQIWNRGWMVTNTWAGGAGAVGRRPSKTFTMWKETIQRAATWKQDQTRTSTSVRTGTKTWKETKDVRTTIGDKQIDSSSINWMRSVPIKITADKLRPETRMHFEFDGVNVDAYCKPIGGANGDPISTDGRGRLRDVTFTIPSERNGIRFNTGMKILAIQDAFDETMTTQTSAAFTSQGTLNTRQRTIMSTLQAVTRSETVRDNKTGTQIRTINRTGGGHVIKSEKKTIREYYDPVAESFMVSGEDGGVFIDSIDVYFYSKDTNGIPVRLEIREMMNGYPVFDAMPAASVMIYPEDVFLSDTGTANTRFQFADPVYLMDGTEYCFVVISDSLEYNIWISELGERDRATNKYIATQDHLGSMFTSQNNSTWTPEQTKDVKFRINKCKFDTTTTATFQMDMKPFEGIQTATGFTPNFQPMLIPGTEVTYNAVVNQDVLNTIENLEDGEDYQLDAQTQLDGGQAYSPIQINVAMKTENPNITPVFNAERMSMITQNNVIYDTAVDEKNQKGVYVSKMVQLANPADDLQMYLSVQEIPETYVKVFYDTGTIVPRYIDIEFNTNTTTHGDYDVNAYEEEYAFVYNTSPELQITGGSGAQSSWNGTIGPEDSSAYVDGDDNPDNLTRMQLTDISHMKKVTTNSYISRYNLEGAQKDTGNFNGYQVGAIWFGEAGDNLNKKFYTKVVKLDGTYDKEEVPVLKIVSQVDATHPDFADGLAVIEEDPITWRAMKDSGSTNTNTVINTDMEFIEHTYTPLKKITNEFNTFRIKIELHTTNPVYMPAVRELRVLAVT